MGEAFIIYFTFWINEEDTCSMYSFTGTRCLFNDKTSQKMESTHIFIHQGSGFIYNGGNKLLDKRQNLGESSTS